VAATITVAPIVEGKMPEWRSFQAELSGARRIEWAQSQRRRGITRQVISLSMDGDRTLAVVYSETSDPGRAAQTLEASDDAFDVWFKEMLGELHEGPLESETVFDSAPKPGPWRGWRG